MPIIEENGRWWNERSDWSKKGEQWSLAWGGPEAQWYGTIFPRVHAFLPAGTILEIGPGYGRWTQYLKGQCKHVLAVDLLEGCIRSCQARFALTPNVFFYVNNGKSLSMISDSSVDFVFSFD